MTRAPDKLPAWYTVDSGTASSSVKNNVTLWFLSHCSLHNYREITSLCE